MGSMGYSDVAVIVPCLDEAAAITSVVDAFHTALPGARVYVYDNGSTDDTVTLARAAGATVHVEPRRGKGNVMKRMFADIDAEVFVMVDGDATYDASDAPEMVRRVREDAHDMVIAARIPTSSDAYRPGHTFGNEHCVRPSAIFLAPRPATC
jgi:glycosyltransferase involved in cell wall biosynthesis